MYVTVQLEAIKMAHKAGYTAVSSQRCGETEDTSVVQKKKWKFVDRSVSSCNF